MRANVAGYLIVLFVFLVIFNGVSATQCIYPTWETTCQKYCLENKFYSIQMNQCWSKDPKNLRCKCNDQDFTEVIKAMFATNNDDNHIPDSGSQDTINDNDKQLV
jgi:hypothetical protein